MLKYFLTNLQGFDLHIAGGGGGGGGGGGYTVSLACSQFLVKLETSPSFTTCQFNMT